MTNTLIEVKNLTKIYKIYDKPIHRLRDTVFPRLKSKATDFTALGGISFAANKGDAIGILGKNGSGKSTLLKIISSVLSATSGECKVIGRVSSILELGTGFNSEYTGHENIYLNGTIMGLTREEIDAKVDDIVAFADIGDFINQPVKIYSSGMFARLAFAVAINVNPDILIIDEVLAVGDSRFQSKCIDKLKELKEQGTTILFVSHATEQVKRFCNRAIWIKDGLIKADGEASSVVDEYENFMLFTETEGVTTERDEAAQVAAAATNEAKLARILDVQINKAKFKTFDELSIEITYEIFEDEIDGFLVGAAIYSADHKNYIFGPNTHLEKMAVKSTKGTHKITYKIPKLTLIKGAFCIDVGIFNNNGIVNLDYKTAAVTFEVRNKYFSEGLVYIEHEWEQIK